PPVPVHRDGGQHHQVGPARETGDLVAAPGRSPPRDEGGPDQGRSRPSAAVPSPLRHIFSIGSEKDRAFVTCLTGRRPGLFRALRAPSSSASSASRLPAPLLPLQRLL